MQEFSNYLRENKISPNGYLALYKLTQIVQETDYINMQLELHKLDITGFIELNSENIYQLTAKGILTLNGGLKYFKSNKKTKYNLDVFKTNIEKYNSYFPKGRKEGMSEGYRSNPKELLQRFIWFFENYKEYSWEDVFKATEAYIKSKNEDYTYLQFSKYFIKKDDISSLAGVCYTISQGNDVSLENEGYKYWGNNN